jgi:hypothetical protein
MLRKLRPRSIYEVMAAIACFGVLAGGTAYATNEWTGANIVDESLTGQDVFNNTIGATDVTNNSLTGGDVADTSSLGPTDIREETLLFNNTLNSNDIGTAAVGSPEVADPSLNDEDISQGTFLHFLGNIGTVPAHDCVYRNITGINAQGDHLLLTPTHDNIGLGLIYAIQCKVVQEHAVLEACNPTGSAINDGTTHFNLLVFDAQ